jgi:hypothetical protein
MECTKGLEFSRAAFIYFCMIREALERVSNPGVMYV